MCYFPSKATIQIFAYCFNWAVFLLLNFESSLYILGTSLLSDICFAHIFSVCGLPIHLLNSVFSKADCLFYFLNFKLSFIAYGHYPKLHCFIYYFGLLLVSGKKVNSVCVLLHLGQK